MGAEIIFIHAEEKNAMESKHRFKDELFTMTGSNMHPNINFVSSDKSLSSAAVQEIVDNAITLFVMAYDTDEKQFSGIRFRHQIIELLENLICPLLLVPVKCQYEEIKKIGLAGGLDRLAEEIKIAVDLLRPFEALIDVSPLAPIFPDLAYEDAVEIEGVIELSKEKFNYRNLKYAVKHLKHHSDLSGAHDEFYSRQDLDLRVLFFRVEGEAAGTLNPEFFEKRVKELNSPLLIFPKTKFE